jgi:hypothetical protein
MSESAVKFAVLDGTTVVNTILLDTTNEFTPPEGHTIKPCPDHISIGWQWAMDLWLAPEEPEPQPIPAEDPSVTAAKMSALATLTALGISEDIARTIVGLPPLT